MHSITETLLVGNIRDAEDPSPTVSALLLVAEEHDVTPPSWVTYAKIPLKEYGAPPVPELIKAVDWLEAHASDNRVMVCCRAGMSRSVSVVIAYLCCVQGMAYDDAAGLALSRRPGAIPLPSLRVAIQKVTWERRRRTTQKAVSGGAHKKPASRCA
jgi:protein-tyrosine phosphatase